VSTWWSGISSIEVGLFAVAVNTVVLVAVSLCTRAPEQANIAVGIPDSTLPRTVPAPA
jgi:SSS family solute:Na+ symporter